MKYITFFKALLFSYLLSAGILYAQGLASLDTISASVQNNLLTIQNQTLRALFSYNNGKMELNLIENTQNGQKIVFGTGSHVFSMDEITDSVVSSDYHQRMVPESPISPRFLEFEIHTVYSKLEIKRIFRVYDNCPAIAIDFKVRLKESQSIEFLNDGTELLGLNLKGKHWKVKATEFFDQTDNNNNLVRETEALLFGNRYNGKETSKLRGNILLSSNLEDPGKSFFLLKEAPASSVELHYPGWDFTFSQAKIQAVGTGISSDDLKTNEWVKTYSIVIGSAGTGEYEFISSLRRYQKNLRKNLPGRDEMIMMNTWGDRNKDANINEVFIKREIDACKKLSISHFQIDDGWQAGRSKNTAQNTGKTIWTDWEKEDWQPDPDKFPNGFETVVEYAKLKGVELGLWFAPSRNNNYAAWKKDAEILIGLYEKYDIRIFKMDAIDMPTKLAEQNLCKMLDSVQSASHYDIVFNLDATADRRGGYHYMYKYGNIFLENRYTDWGNYYPYQTLRNLWMLSKYVPPEKLQIEFLNIWRNEAVYGHEDIFAPANYSFDYVFAVTMMAQPLAWFEGSGLPDEAASVSSAIKKYSEFQHDLHSGYIFPIGDEPSGGSWTGFQSVNKQEGYLLVFRENSELTKKPIKTYIEANQKLDLIVLMGEGKNFTAVTNSNSEIEFVLNRKNSYALYKYHIQE